MAEPLELPEIVEGTWEEILRHAPRFAGRKLRVAIYPDGREKRIDERREESMALVMKRAANAPPPVKRTPEEIKAANEAKPPKDYSTPYMMDELLALVPPPANPTYTSGAFSWAEIEEALGIELPEDYKQIVSLYGYGLFGDYLGFYNPFLCQTLDEVREMYTRLAVIVNANRKEFPAFYSHWEFYPEGKVILLGFTDDAGNVSWRQERATPEPLHFLTMTDADFTPNFGNFRGTLSKFLVAWMKNERLIYGFREEMTVEERMRFVPLDR